MFSTLYWDGDAGNNLWEDARNWSRDSPTGGVNVLPGANDDVVIDAGEGESVVFSVSAGSRSVRSLYVRDEFTLNGGTLTVLGDARLAGRLNGTGGTLTLNGETIIDGAFVHTSGIVTGSGNISVVGTYTWNGGTIAGSGRFLVENIATLNLPTAGHKILQRVIENRGIAWWTGGTWIFNSGGFVNQTHFIAESNGGLSLLGSGSTQNFFKNNGLFEKTGLSSAAISNSGGQIRFDNLGRVEVFTQGLGLGGSGYHTGEFYVSQFARLNFSGFHALSDLSSIRGAGNVQIHGTFRHDGVLDIGGELVFPSSNPGVDATLNASVSVGSRIIIRNGTARFNSDVWAANMTLDGGYLDGSGEVEVAGEFLWPWGVMQGAGRTVVARGGQLRADSDYPRVLMRVLQIDGTATTTARTWSFFDGHLLVGSGATFTHMHGWAGSFVGSGVNSVVVHGEFRVSGVLRIQNISVENRGRISIFGNADITGNLVNVEQGTLNGGSWYIGPGATLSTASGTIFVNAADVVLDGAATWTALAGMTQNNGRLSLLGGGDLMLAGSFINGGELRLSPGSTLSMQSFRQAGQGSLVIEGARLNGVYQIGQIDAALSAIIDGDVRFDALDGLTAVGDASLQFIRTQALAGYFRRVSLLGSASDLKLSLAYSFNDLRFVLIPSGPARMKAVL